MKNNNDWSEKANQALNSLDGIERATANPFLFTRIKERISERSSKWSRAADFIGRPAIVFSVTALFVALNAWAVFIRPVEKHITRPAQEREQAFDQDYATVNYTLGDLNTNK